ncbi:hypothetical protein DL767_004984 [Monosporascus sp. MG133]|nr:hypothetical protein DL767_004984 [Monosporascus sp. MG133]
MLPCRQMRCNSSGWGELPHKAFSSFVLAILGPPIKALWFLSTSFQQITITADITFVCQSKNDPRPAKKQKNESSAADVDKMSKRAQRIDQDIKETKKKISRAGTTPNARAALIDKLADLEIENERREAASKKETLEAR